ncbi:MAG: hypothetical protein MJ231_06985, partial [bacterium]|nr:hypothetical protein [bacterium]
ALLITTLFLGQISYGANIDVATTMQSQPENHDRIWAGAFQLAWNDLRKKTIHAQIRFPEGTPTAAIELNQGLFSTTYAPKGFYYKLANYVKPNTKQKIAKAISKKFNETSEILNSVEMTPAKKRYFAYAMFKKDFLYAEPFENLGKSNFGLEQTAEYYGLNKNADENLRRNVKVLFYNSPHDYAVKLLGNNEEDIVLYRSVSNKPFNYVYGDILRKSENFEGIKIFTEEDTLKVPKIYVSEKVNYTEFSDKRIKGTTRYIDSAFTDIKLSIDGSGIIPKKRKKAPSLIVNPKYEIIPRDFSFDGTFFIFIKGRYSYRPYCAVRVNDISNFQ